MSVRSAYIENSFPFSTTVVRARNGRDPDRKSHVDSGERGYGMVGF